METTVSVIKADIGSIGGHIRKGGVAMTRAIKEILNDLGDFLERISKIHLDPGMTAILVLVLVLLLVAVLVSVLKGN